MFKEISVFSYIVFVLSSYSLTFGWIESPLFEFLRQKIVITKSKITYLCHCYHCAGFWLSLLVSNVMFNTTISNHILLSLSSCILIFVFDRIVTLLEKIIVYFTILNSSK